MRRKVRTRFRIKAARVRSKIRRKGKLIVELLDNWCFW